MDVLTEFIFGLFATIGCGVAIIHAADKRDRATRIAQMEARSAYLAERDPHCDSCALHTDTEPLRPVQRCPKCMSCIAGLIGDPLFGFDFEKYKEEK